MKDRQNKGDLEIQKTGIVIESGLCAPIPISRQVASRWPSSQPASCLVYATKICKRTVLSYTITHLLIPPSKSTPNRSCIIPFVVHSAGASKYQQQPTQQLPGKYNDS